MLGLGNWGLRAAVDEWVVALGGSGGGIRGFGGWGLVVEASVARAEERGKI